ncbi:3-hydroxybutyrate dehydrogenase [Alteromonadaceae bacterium M269]|nr:3-hydroxybutyrate dehydrogenase [Alteromonadaceae bacterium M269]
MPAKTVLITGGASGIGLAIGEYLGQQGHHIILSDLNEDTLINAAQTLKQKGIETSHLVLDVTNPSDIQRLQAQQESQPIDVLINNAGLQHVAPLEDFPADKWQLLINLMLVAPAMLTQALLPMMRANNYGRIINVGSIHSLVASPFKSAYVAAKHGLLGFSKVLALETGDCNVTINTLCPSYVETPMVKKQIASQAREHGISEQEVVDKIMLEPMPKKAFIGTDELAETANFLMQNTARNITGQTLVLDGGWTAR